jgi:hypothetical protein
MIEKKRAAIIPFPGPTRRTSQESASGETHSGRVSQDELGQLNPFDKALAALMFTLQNLDRGLIEIDEAERQAKCTLSSLRRRIVVF